MEQQSQQSASTPGAADILACCDDDIAVYTEHGEIRRRSRHIVAAPIFQPSLLPPICFSAESDLSQPGRKWHHLDQGLWPRVLLKASSNRPLQQFAQLCERVQHIQVIVLATVLAESERAHIAATSQPLSTCRSPTILSHLATEAKLALRLATSRAPIVRLGYKFWTERPLLWRSACLPLSSTA